MRLSTKAQYAVRAMVSLNLTEGDKPVSIRDISEREEISLSYLEQLFVKLRRGKIVNSVRGPGGGYVLARSADLIRVDQIIDSVEEQGRIVKAAIKKAYSLNLKFFDFLRLLLFREARCSGNI